MCPCHDPISYIPSGYTGEQADIYRGEHREQYLHDARETMKRQLRAMIEFKKRGVEAFEYGTSIRKECMDAGMPEAEAKQDRGFVAGYIRPLFCEGRGPFRWTCISGDPADWLVWTTWLWRSARAITWWSGGSVWPASACPSRLCPPVSATWALASASASVWP